MKPEDAPVFTRGQLSFIQDGNADGTTGEIESIDFEIESSPGESLEGDGFYYVLRTEGWSFDTPEELLALIKKVQSKIKYNEGEDG